MAQFDQIVLFYNQLINIADEVEELIEKELFDDIITKLEIHDNVITQLRLAKKCVQLSFKEQNEVDQLEKILKEKEKKNMEQLQANMLEAKKELNKINTQTKIKSAYGQINENQGSIIDVDDSYRPNVD